MTNRILLAKLVIALLSLGAATGCLRSSRLKDLSPQEFSRRGFVLLAASRLLLFGLVFLLLKIEPQSDVNFYYDQAKQVLAGKVPYRDFVTAYGPLFPYLSAGAVGLWDSAKSLVLLAILFELASFPLWLATGRLCFTEAEARSAAVLYIFNPIAILTTPIGGYNHVWLSFFLALSFWSLLRQRTILSGLAFGFGVVMVKFLSLLHAPVLFLGSRQRFRWLFALLLPIITAYALIARHGRAALDNVKFHAFYLSSGNLPYFLTLFGLDIKKASVIEAINFIGVIILASVFIFFWLRLRVLTSRQMVLLASALMFLLMLVSKKAFVPYLLIALFPICLAVASTANPRTAQLTFLSFSTLAAMEPSLWFRWTNESPLYLLWSEHLPPSLSRSLLAVFCMVEMVLLAGYAYYSMSFLRRLLAGEGLTEGRPPKILVNT